MERRPRAASAITDPLDRVFHVLGAGLSLGLAKCTDKRPDDLMGRCPIDLLRPLVSDIVESVVFHADTADTVGVNVVTG